MRHGTCEEGGRRIGSWGIAKVEEGGSHDEEAVEQLEIGWCQNWRETREIGRERGTGEGKRSEKRERAEGVS